MFISWIDTTPNAKNARLENLASYVSKAQLGVPWTLHRLRQS